MMELGATVCTPQNPSCDVCPLARRCAAREQGVVAAYPVKAERKELPVRRETALLATDERGRVLLVRKTEGGLLQGLWELPVVGKGPSLVHVFSHFRLELETVRARDATAAFRDPREVPLSTATRKALVLAGLLSASDEAIDRKRG
jgi:adenine-specific DNA glycosylase